MDFIASLLAKIIYAFFKLFKSDLEETSKKSEVVKEEGKRAEEAAEDAVSEVTDQPFEKPKSGELAPIKEGTIVRTIKKGSEYLKHRRSRKRL